jgi:arylsulfatase A-like enzyme
MKRLIHTMMHNAGGRMIAKLLLAFCLGCTASSFAASALSSGPTPDRKPNIVFLIADDMGYGDLGVQGDKEVRSPHIDALAASGRRFTQYYANHPECAPSRAALLTGMYQQRMGFEFNPGGSGPNFGLPVDTPTMAERLKTRGYATALFGKWHQGYKPEHHPNARGFDEFYGFLGGTHPYTADGVTQYNATDAADARTNRLLRQNTPVDLPGHLTEALGAEASRFIRDHKSDPFFLMLAFNAPHVPMQTTRGYYQRFAHIADEKRRIHLAMVEALDDQVGAVLQTLKTEGLERDTLVVFISDNGGPVHQTTSSNYPLSGGKATFWEGGIRVPAVMYWPGTIAAGGTIDAMSSGFDMTVTALTLAGAMPAQGLDGVDLMPYLSGTSKAPIHDALYWRQGKRGAMRQGDWKLIKDAEQWRLFDLRTDLAEQRDLAASEPQKLDQLRALWNAWSAQMKPPAWSPVEKPPLAAVAPQQL